MKSARNGDDLCLEGHHGHNVVHVEHGKEQDFLCLAKDFSLRVKFFLSILKVKSARNGDDLCLEGHHSHNAVHVQHGEEQDFLCLAKDFSQKESLLKEKVFRSENYITIFYKIISFSSMQIPEFYESLNSFSGSPTLSRFSKGVKSAGPFELMTSSKCCPHERTIWPT